MQDLSNNITVTERRQRIGLSPLEPTYRAPEERIQDFNECNLGFSIRQAMEEASRCIHCPQPSACVVACPMGNDIPTALWYIEQGDFVKAAAVYRETNPLPEICGRVCPGESTCAASCVLTKRERGIATGALEAFASDYQRETVGVPLPPVAEPSGKRVAVIGAGPAGLAAAENLAASGHAVTVFDAMPEPGGLLVYGIPSFKLDKSLVGWKVDWLKQMGVQFTMNTRIGKQVTLDDLLALGFDAIFIGTGAQVEAKLDVPGESLNRVYASLNFLTRANLSDYKEPIQIGRRVAVIGGGDTATDCLRSAIRLGAEEVTCYYRRTEREMPGNQKERHHAEEEGARFEYLVAPVELLDRNGDGSVDAMNLIRMELGAPDQSGRRRPVPVEGSEFVEEVDDVVLAIGFWPDPVIGETTPTLKTEKWGLIVVDPETGATSREGIFAGGDNVTGPALVNEAIAAGKRASAAINEYLREY